MKTFILFLLLVCGSSIAAQTASLDKIKGKQPQTKPTITLKQSSISNKASYLLSGDLPKHKMKITPTVNSNFSIYLDEYVGGVCQPKNELEDLLITNYFCKANQSFKGEIVIDNTQKDKLIISALTPEFIKYAYKDRNAGKAYKVAAFNASGYAGSSKYPVLLIYEDDTEATQEKLLKQAAVNDSLAVRFDPQKKPFSGIDRYMVLFIERNSKQ